jgi:hypothetical protein
VRASNLAAAAALFTVLLSAAACSGSGGSPTSAPAATTSGSQPTAAGGAPTTAPGGGGTTAPGGGTSDACAALSLAEIKTATGLDYGPGTPDGSGGCSWEISTGTYSNVTLAFDSSTAFSAIKPAFPGGTDLTVGGHPAYMGVAGNTLQSLWVDLGTSVLTIIIAPAPADAQAVTRKLAELALAKM